MAEHDAAGAASTQTGGTLLLVDDEANILASLRRLLRKDGYTLLTAGSGEEGLTVLGQHAVDVILSDQRMPGMSGVDFLREAKRLRPDTVRLVLSGYTELQSITNAINEGAIFKFLTKPWDDEQLRANIAEAVQFKRLADENLRLSAQLREANQRLEAMLADKQGQIMRDRQAMNVLHEVLQLLPWPLIGVDGSGLIASTNEAADRLLGGGVPLLGSDFDAVLPAEVCAAVSALTEGETVLKVGAQRWRLRVSALGAQSGADGRLLIFMPEAADHD